MLQLKITFKGTVCNSPTLGGRRYLSQCKDSVVSLVQCCTYLKAGTWGQKAFQTAPFWQVVEQIRMKSSFRQPVCQRKCEQVEETTHTDEKTRGDHANASVSPAPIIIRTCTVASRGTHQLNPEHF